MFVKTLPQEIEDDLLDHPELKTMEQIIDYLRSKLLYKNQKSLASYIKPSSQRVNALMGHEESDDDEEEEVPRGRGRNKVSVKATIAKLMEQQSEMIAAFQQRKASPRRGNSPRGKKFMWTGGCHECGGDHLKKDCSKWQKLMADNANKMPAGHVNAYSKARDKWMKENGVEPRKARPKAKAKAGTRAHAKALMEMEDSEFSSDDSEFSMPVKALRTPCFALPLGTPVKNKFQALDDGLQDEEVKPEHIVALNSWAHKVNVRPTKPKKSSLKKSLIAQVTNEDLDAAINESKKLDFTFDNCADLEKAIAQSEVLRQRLPGIDGSTMPLYAAMVKKCPSPDTLQEGECWAMVDSGSGVDGMDIDAICPGVKVEKAANPITCITANGEEMIADQVASLHVELDGQGCDIPFSKLPLTMPIISVRRHIHRGHRCRIQENGGYFRNVATRKKARFIEKDGVYFMRMKVRGSTDEFPPLTGFTRPGSP